MTECNHETFGFSNCRKRQVRVNFSGGSISSNGGALLLREVDRRMMSQRCIRLRTTLDIAEALRGRVGAVSARKIFRTSV